MLKKLSASVLEKEAQRLGARYYLSNGYYVFVLQASHQKVPESLQPYVEHQHSTATDRQLSTTEYQKTFRGFMLNGLTIDKKHTLLVAGPCAVESEAQIEQTAKFFTRYRLAHAARRGL